MDVIFGNWLRGLDSVIPISGMLPLTQCRRYLVTRDYSGTFTHLQLIHLPGWYLKVQKEKSSLIRASSGTSNAGLPMTTVSIKRHCLNAFKWVSSQCFQLTTQSSMSPWALYEWTRMLSNIRKHIF